MSKTEIPRRLRRKVAEQAKHRCGYCLTPERIVGMEMEVDHIIPEALEGKTEEANLWLACERCNKHKGDRVKAPDPETGEMASIPASSAGLTILLGLQKEIISLG